MNQTISCIQLGDNRNLSSSELDPESIQILQTLSGRVILDSRPIGSSGILRRYQGGSEGGSIMSIIKNKIGHNKPSGPLTLSARILEKTREHLISGKENKIFQSNLPTTVSEELFKQNHGSDSLLTVPQKLPHNDKPKSQLKNEYQKMMMSRIGWLFELRNLFDKLKRKAGNTPVTKGLFLGQFKRVIGVDSLYEFMNLVNVSEYKKLKSELGLTADSIEQRLLNISCEELTEDLLINAIMHEHSLEDQKPSLSSRDKRRQRKKTDSSNFYYDEHSESAGKTSKNPPEEGSDIKTGK